MAQLPTTGILTLDWSLAESLDSSKRWVLSAMKEHGQAMVTMLWRILGNEQDVCDVYQDVFVMLAGMDNSFRPNNLRAYLFGTASNLAVSMLRRRKLDKKAHEELARRYTPAVNRDPAGFLDADALKHRLRQHLSELPEPLQSIICLHDLAGLSYSDTAQILNLSNAAVRVYRHRAVKLLASWMVKEEQRGQI